MKFDARSVLLLALLAAVLWFGSLGSRQLIDPDEGRYAEISREMAVSGDWITPRLNDIKYFEKPALQYWASAVIFKLGGDNDFTARLWPGLLGFLGILLVGFTGRKLWGQEAGLFSATLLAGSLWWIANGHFLNLDMGVSFFLTLTLCAFLLAQRDEAIERERKSWMAVAWAAMALATLSKGLIGIVIPGAVLVLYTLVSRQWLLWLRMELVNGLLILLALAAPWFVLVSLANPEFAYKFFIYEHFVRFATAEHNRPGSWWYFFPILLIGLLPWVSLLPQMLKTGFARANGRRFKAEWLLLVWCVFIFVFFSRSHSKLPSYILPMFPALALLGGKLLRDLRPTQLIGHWLTLAMIGGLLLWFVPSLAQTLKAGTPATAYPIYAGYAQAAAMGIIGCALAATLLAWKEYKLASVLTACLATLGPGQLLMLGHDAAFGNVNSGAVVANAIKPHLAAGSRVYSVDYLDQSVPYYLQQPLVLVDYEDEFTFGMDQQPEKRYDYAKFSQHWLAETQPAAVLSFKAYERLQAAGLPMQVIYRDLRRMAVIKPQPGQPASAPTPTVPQP